MKKVLKNANITILVLIILLSTILIGTPILESNVQIVYIASGIFSLFYFTSKIVKKEKIITNPIDIMITTLVFSTVIPFLFQTYVSLTQTDIRSVKNKFIIKLLL